MYIHVPLHTPIYTVAVIHFETEEYIVHEENGSVLLCVLLETATEILLQVHIYTLSNTAVGK